MRIICILCIIFFCSTFRTAWAADELLEAERTGTIEFLMERAIADGLIIGGVVVIGNHAGILYQTAKGRISPAPDAMPIGEHTLFDIASLTKVFATAPAVMKLLETGRISLMDPLTRWFPEFEGSDLEDITILNLLTHTTGLSDVELPSEEPLKAAIQKVAGQKILKLPGNRFRYADINFILLGELVRRVTGVSLDQFCREEFYVPLHMTETMFNPPPNKAGGIATTHGTENELLSGVVQDENARHLGGVAGHAGLFSTADDLSRFVRMYLNNGTLDDTRIFSERVVKQMTAPYFYSNGNVVRGLGWDIYSPYSAPKGRSFSEMSFGHTGYSGSSVWIDPQADLFVILLTSRLDHRGTRQFNKLRSDISTLAAAIYPSAGKQSSAPKMP